MGNEASPVQPQASTATRAGDSLRRLQRLQVTPQTSQREQFEAKRQRLIREAAERVAAADCVAAKPPDIAAQRMAVEKQRQREERERLWRDAEIPAAFRDEIELRGDGWKAAFAKLCHDVKAPGAMLVLCGSNGPGKTRMGVELIRAAVNPIGWSCRYFTGQGLIDHLTAAARGEPSEALALNNRLIRDVDLLVVDEIEKRRESEHAFRSQERILRERSDWGGRTVLITNLKPADLTPHLGVAVARRIPAESVIVCDWPSFRRPSLGDKP